MPDLHLAARRAALKYGVDPNIFLRMIGQESGFNPHARSPKGAQGIAQFIPSTARAYGVNLNDNRVTDDLEGAARYLRANLDRTGGSYTRALSIYNSGSPTGYQHIPRPRTTSDPSSVDLRLARQLVLARLAATALGWLGSFWLCHAGSGHGRWFRSRQPLSVFACGPARFQSAAAGRAFQLPAGSVLAVEVSAHGSVPRGSAESA
jgi:hypothetical protein